MRINLRKVSFQLLLELGQPIGFAGDYVLADQGEGAGGADPVGSQALREGHDHRVRFPCGPCGGSVMSVPCICRR